MARPERLLQLMQLMRVVPSPVTAEVLAAELGVSLRSVYRDIASLRSTGAVIDGAAGFGYTLIEDPALPPMMFSADEMEALVLGLREVGEVGDPVLAQAAGHVLAKINACLPSRMRSQFQNSVLHAKRFHDRPQIDIDVSLLRRAAREERVVEIAYTDVQGRATRRVIWPLSIVFMEHALMLLARCLLRDGFRAFRLDRIGSVALTGDSFRPHRVALLRQCQEEMFAPRQEIACGEDTTDARQL